MNEDTERPQIDSAKLRVGGNIAGAMFTIGSMLIFLFGIPVLRYMFPVAILAGCAVALVFRLIRHETPGAPWLRSAIEKKTEVPSGAERKENPGPSASIFLGVPTAC